MKKLFVLIFTFLLYSLSIYAQRDAGSSFALPDSLNGQKMFMCMQGRDVYTYIDTLTKIDKSKITSLFIPQSYFLVEFDLFDNWFFSLNSIEVEKENLAYCSIDGAVYDKNRTTLLYCPAGKQTLVLPNSVKTIGGTPGQQARDKIYIGDSLPYIEAVKLSKILNFSQLQVSNNNPYYTSDDGVLYSKNKDTLKFCPQAKVGNLVIPTTVKNIEKDALISCYKLTSVYIPDSLKEFNPYVAFSYSNSSQEGTFAFQKYSGLSEIIVSAGNLRYSSEDGVLYDKDKTTLIYCPPGKEGKLVIPASVKKIVSKKKLCGCSKLTSVWIPDSVTDINENYFFSLFVIINEESRGDNITLTEYSNLSEITVSNGNPVYSSQDGILYNKNKTVLLYSPRAKQGTVVIPASVKMIKDGAFIDNIVLKSVVFTSDSVKEISPSLFSCCTKLESVTLPQSITQIGLKAFYNCWDLKTVTVAWDKPINLKDQDKVFYAVDLSRCTLRVPKGTRKAYRKAPVWRNFGHIVEVE
jgi:hypothetical protein